jgi:hypothetical protein
MKRAYRVVVIAVGVFGVFAANAFALSTAPTVDTAALTSTLIYPVAAALLLAVLAVIAPVFLAKTPFAIVHMVKRAVNKLMGRASASSAAG